MITMLHLSAWRRREWSPTHSYVYLVLLDVSTGLKVKCCTGRGTRRNPTPDEGRSHAKQSGQDHIFIQKIIAI